MNHFLLCTGIFLMNFALSYGQKLTPVTWTFEIKKVNETEIELMATANIKKGWTIYSQFTEDNGPVPTAFIIGSETMSFEEKSISSKDYDPIFEVNVIKFKDKAVFTKIIKIIDKNEVSGYVTFMTCDGEKCLPPADVEFSFKL